MPHEVNQRVNNKEVEYNQHFRIKYDVDDASHCRGSGACSAVEDAGEEQDRVQAGAKERFKCSIAHGITTSPLQLLLILR